MNQSQSDALNVAFGGADTDVAFHLEVSGLDGRLGVRTVSLREAISEPFEAVVEALVDDAPPEVGALLGRSAVLQIERGEEQRTVRGIVRHAVTQELVDGHGVTLHLVPSIWRLGLGVDSRIYLDTTIPDLVREVVQEYLGGTIDVDTSLLTQTYEAHELVSQYQESTLNFLHRWLEQEGIFYFVTVEDERERLMLADAVESLPLARPSQDGRVAYRGDAGAVGASELVFDLRHEEELGVTEVAIADYDWTHPRVPIGGERRGESNLSPAPELYDHTDAVTFHGYQGEKFERNSADRGAQIRSEALALMRQRWAVQSDVVTAQPGHVLRIEGAPEAEQDGAYLVVRVESGGDATEGVNGTWANSLVVVPTSIPFRLPPRTPRPVVAGPETAIVVGPADQEIHTDEHGRVKVHFHWDRQRARTEERSSCWVRVAQGWAGPGFGSFFLPRIGMEVVVSFLGGHPDRPLVTGCVYNGDNRARVDLPDKSSQSVIRTRSTPNSEGFNELRFEDRAGAEEVYVHAQRNLRELILHDHDTHVKNDHTNIVDGKDDETVGGDQWLRVKGLERRKWVENNEINEIQADRESDVFGNDTLRVHSDATTEVTNNAKFDVGGQYDATVVGAQSWTIDGGSTLTVTGGITQTIESGGWTTTTTGNVSHTVTGGMVVDLTDGITVTAGANVGVTAVGSVEITAQEITLTSATTIKHIAPTGHKNVTPSEECNIASDVNTNAKSLAEIARMKFAMYSLAMTIYDLKIDGGAIKVDLHKVKFGNQDMKIALEKLHLAMSPTARLLKASATVIA